MQPFPTHRARFPAVSSIPPFPLHRPAYVSPACRLDVIMKVPQHACTREAALQGGRTGGSMRIGYHRCNCGIGLSNERGVWTGAATAKPSGELHLMKSRHLLNSGSPPRGRPVFTFSP